MKNLLLILICMLPFSRVSAIDIDKTITLDGLQRHYIIHLPANYSALKKLPIIFALHGGGGTAKNTVGQYSLNPVADKHDCIVIYPDAMNKSWSMKGISSKVKGNSQDIDDVHFISVLIDTAAAYYKGDVKNVFCTGISRGGIFSLFLASRLSNRIKAIAPVCASIPQSIAGDYAFAHPTPVLMINGTGDPLINYNGGPGKFGKPSGDEDEYDMLPTEVLVKKIKVLNGCTTDPQTYNFPDVDPGDGCTAVQYTYSCNNVMVKFVKVINGGHTWPGGKQYLPKFIIGRLCMDFKAEDEIVNFFMAVK